MAIKYTKIDEHPHAQYVQEFLIVLIFSPKDPAINIDSKLITEKYEDWFLKASNWSRGTNNPYKGKYKGSRYYKRGQNQRKIEPQQISSLGDDQNEIVFNHTFLDKDQRNSFHESEDYQILKNELSSNFNIIEDLVVDGVSGHNEVDD